MFRLGENCPFDYCDTYLTELSLFVAKATSSLYYLPKENLRFVTFSKMSDDDSVHKAETRERRQNRSFNHANFQAVYSFPLVLCFRKTGPLRSAVFKMWRTMSWVSFIAYSVNEGRFDVFCWSQANPSCG